MELKSALHTCGFPTANQKYNTVLPTVLPMLYIRSLTAAPFWAIVLSHKRKPPWLSQLGAWEAHLLGGSLKGCVAKCGVQTLPCSGKSWNWELLPDCMALCWGQGYGEISLSLSYPFLTWVFSHSPDVYESVSFWISFKGSCSVCSCIFSASVWGGFRGLLRHHLSQPPAHSLSDCLYLWLAPPATPHRT